jgi:hypothetical protein
VTSTKILRRKPGIAEFVDLPYGPDWGSRFSIGGCWHLKIALEDHLAEQLNAVSLALPSGDISSQENRALTWLAGSKPPNQDARI